MASMLTWTEIQKTFKNEWVAMTEWEEDAHGDIIRGCVSYHNPSQKNLYQYISAHIRPQSQKVATRYTGNVQGPLLLGLWSHEQN